MKEHDKLKGIKSISCSPTRFHRPKISKSSTENISPPTKYQDFPFTQYAIYNSRTYGNKLLTSPKIVEPEYSVAAQPAAKTNVRGTNRSVARQRLGDEVVSIADGRSTQSKYRLLSSDTRGQSDQKQAGLVELWSPESKSLAKQPVVSGQSSLNLTDHSARVVHWCISFGYQPTHRQDELYIMSAAAVCQTPACT